MANDAQLSGEWRTVSTLAEREAIWYPQRRPVSIGSATGADKYHLHEGLQRGEDGRQPREHRTAAGTGRYSAGIRQLVPHLCIQPDCEGGRARQVAVGERPRFGAT